MGLAPAPSPPSGRPPPTLPRCVSLSATPGPDWLLGPPLRAADSRRPQRRRGRSSSCVSPCAAGRGPVLLNPSLPLLHRLSPASPGERRRRSSESLLQRDPTSARASSRRRRLLRVCRSQKRTRADLAGSDPHHRLGLGWILGVAFAETLTRLVPLAQGLSHIRCCGSPRASSPHRLATMQLPPARGCHQRAPRRTVTSNPAPMPGTPPRTGRTRRKSRSVGNRPGLKYLPSVRLHSRTENRLKSLVRRFAPPSPARAAEGCSALSHLLARRGAPPWRLWRFGGAAPICQREAADRGIGPILARLRRSERENWPWLKKCKARSVW